MGPTATLTHRKRLPHLHQPPVDALTPLGDAGVGHWLLDATRSSASFRHRALWGLVTVRGTFDHLSGEGEILADGMVQAEIIIPAASLDTRHAKRDRHLRSVDFFNTPVHPFITFTTTHMGLDEHGILRI